MINTQYRKPLPGTRAQLTTSTPGGGERHRPRRLGQGGGSPPAPGTHRPRPRREPGASVRSGHPRRVPRPDSAQQARSRLPLVPGAGGVSRHPGADRPGGPRGPSRRHRRAGGDPAQVNPVVPVQLIVDHSLAVECGGFDPRRSRRTAPSRIAATRIVSTSSTGPSRRSRTSR